MNSLPIVVAPTAPSVAEIGAVTPAPLGELSTEIVVIGTGAGGAVAGCELAKKHRVLFLEQGGAYPRKELQRKSFLWSSEHLYARRGAQLSSGGNVRFAIISGATVGGSTVLNSAIAFKPPDHRLKEWAAVVGDERLQPDAMRPFVDEMWARIGVMPTHAGIGRKNNDALRIGMERLSLREETRHGWMDRNAPGCVGCGACHLGCPSGGKASMDRAVLPEAVQRGAVIHSRVRADHIVVEGGRATRVECTVMDDDGAVRGALVVKADLVVVAGSALRSPVLLKKSGLGGSEVGKHLAAHAACGVFAEFPEPIDMWNGVPQGYWAEVPGRDDVLLEVANVGPDQLFAFFARAGKGGLEAVKRLRHIAMAGPMTRDPQTGVVSVGRDGDLSFTYEVTDAHLEKWRAGMALGARAYFAAGATRVALSIGDLEFYDSEADALRAIDRVRAPSDMLAAYGSHPQGTCRMGAVVDADGRVNGTDNVYVMDGSIFPTTLGVNPQVTIMSLALALSRRLVG